MKLTKIRAGWYATEDGRAAVMIDVDGEDWAVVLDPIRGRLRSDKDVGEAVDWFPTKRAAIAFLQERHAARERFNAALAKSSPALWREDV